MPIDDMEVDSMPIDIDPAAWRVPRAPSAHSPQYHIRSPDLAVLDSRHNDTNNDNNAAQQPGL